MSEVRVAVTGVGVVSPGGWSAETTWDAVVSGRSCVRELTRFALGSAGTRVVACVPGREDELPDDASLALEYGISAARDAVADAGLDPGAIDEAVIANHGDRRVPVGDADGLLLRLDDMSARIAASVGARRHTATHGACAAGTIALGLGAKLIRHGVCDVVLAGAADSLVNGYDFFQFCGLQAMSKHRGDPTAASRPFDSDRDGYVMGEGAAFLVLESERHATARGRTPRGYITGFGASQNAFHYITMPEDGLGPARAMGNALRSARMSPRDIGYINAHGTGTRLNDRCETTAIRRVFGRDADDVPVSSTKSVIGHATAAAGAIEAAIVLMALERQTLPPTINLDRPDPDCDLRHIPWVAEERELGAAMSNSFGFGGHSASIILEVAS